MPTVFVKIAVAVDPSGKWNALGWPVPGKLCSCSDHAMELAVEGVDDGAATYWVTAVLQVTEPRMVEGKVEEVKCG